MVVPFIALCLVLSSCIKDEELPVLVDDGTVMFVCEDSNPATKTTLNGLQTEWVANTDKAGIFSPQASITAGGVPGVVNEPLTALSNGARSQFSGAVYWNIGDHNFYSYYPYAAGTPPHTAVPVSLPASQTQSAGNNSAHLSALDFLVAKPYTAKYPGSSGAPATVSLRYNHLFAIIEFQIIRSTGSGAITKVKLTGKVPLAFEAGTINLAQNTPASGVSYGIDGMTNTSNIVTVSLDAAITPTNDYSTTPKVYMVVLPGTHIGELKIAFESGGVFKVVKKSDVTFERGKKYVIRVDAAGAIVSFIDGFDLEPVTINGLTWAPVNAGYDANHRYGLFYQWHRKYGIEYLGIETQSIELITGPISLSDGNIIENQGKFIKKSVSPLDWCTPQQLTWNMSNEFNPCPEGWRLPTSQEYQSLLSNGSTWVSNSLLGVDNVVGRWIGPNHDNPDIRPTTALFFPPNGRIIYNSSTASATNRGTQGFYQVSDLSGTTNTAYAKTLYFTSTATNIGSLDRSAAGSVRCVKTDNDPHPIIKTIKANNILYNSFTTGGKIEFSGSNTITERGIVYSSSVNPTTSNNKIVYAGGDIIYSININGLNENSSWYYRSYVISGGTPIYGQEYNIVTPFNWGGLNEATIAGITWSPVNAGYDDNHPYGLLYQWSRRYGQGYDTTETRLLTIISNATTLATANSITYKDYFYAPTSSPYDCISPQQSSWSMSVTYNPCPVGWRVPTENELNSLLSSGHTWTESGPNSMKGRWYGGNHSSDHQGSIFLPASGFRTEAGNSLERNSSAYYWVSTVPTNPSYTMYAPGLGVSISNSSFSVLLRATGLSVRCVKN